MDIQALNEKIEALDPKTHGALRQALAAEYSRRIDGAKKGQTEPVQPSPERFKSAAPELVQKDERELEDLIRLYSRITSESQQLSNGKRDGETDKALRAKLAQAKRTFQIRWGKLPEVKQMQMVDRLIGDSLLPGIIADALKIFDGAKVISLI
jgi:hypothetical protein